METEGKDPYEKIIQNFTEWKDGSKFKEEFTKEGLLMKGRMK